MSKTAFQIAGEPLELPPNVTAWRVRRISRRRGAPEVIYSNHAPLVLRADDAIDLIPANRR